MIDWLKENLLDFFCDKTLSWQVRGLEIAAGERGKKVLRLVQGMLGQSYNHASNRFCCLTSGMLWDHWIIDCLFSGILLNFLRFQLLLSLTGCVRVQFHRKTAGHSGPGTLTATACAARLTADTSDVWWQNWEPEDFPTHHWSTIANRSPIPASDWARDPWRRQIPASSPRARPHQSCFGPKRASACKLETWFPAVKLWLF